MQLKNNDMQRILLFFGACALFLLFWGGCTSCSPTKKLSHEVHLTDSVRIRDSIAYKTVIHRRDSTVIKDTTIRVKYDRAEWSFPATSTKDTAIRSGRATLRIAVNNGVISGQADCDSFDIVVNDMRLIIHDKSVEVENVTKEFQDYKKTHTEVIVRAVQRSWFGRVWDTFKKWCVWIVLLELIAFLLWLFFGRK
jgi:hypothetical protein